MINTELLKIIVFCFKILFYQFDVQELDVDVLESGNYQMSIHYITQKDGLHISASAQGKTEKLMVVKTIDNALYQIILGEETPFTLDLADWYMSLDWKQLGKSDLIIYNGDEEDTNRKKLIEIKTGSENVFILVLETNQTFVIHKDHFSK